MPDPTNAARQRAWYQRKRQGLPSPLQPCSACDRRHLGAHGSLCVYCWRKSPDGLAQLAAAKRRQRKRKRQATGT